MVILYLWTKKKNALFLRNTISRAQLVNKTKAHNMTQNLFLMTPSISCQKLRDQYLRNKYSNYNAILLCKSSSLLMHKFGMKSIHHRTNIKIKTIQKQYLSNFSMIICIRFKSDDRNIFQQNRKYQLFKIKLFRLENSVDNSTW